MKCSLLLAFRRFNLGVILALAAWLMQLSVFLTPIFSSQISVGHGVCAELALYTAPAASSHAHTHHHADATAALTPSAMDMAGIGMSAMASMPAMALQPSIDTAHPSTPPLDTSADHHQSHALCGFCLLFGHSVLPPTLLSAVLYLPTMVQASASRITDYLSRAIPASKIHHPQGRAPPLQFVLL